MKLQTRILLIISFVFLVTFGIMEYFHYRSVKNEAFNELRRDARNIRGMLMSTRRVYHHQFLDSDIPLTDKTLGFLPAYALSRISEDFKNWADDGLTFNNVSDRPRNPRNAADLIEKEAISYFQKNLTEKDRLVPFKTAEGELYYHYSAPIWVEEYCLKCHGKREDAHVTISTRYAEAFDYKLGDLRGIMSIKLPVKHLQARMWDGFRQILWIHLASFSSMFLLVSWLLNRYINKPLKILTSGLETVASGSLDHSIDGLSGEMANVSNTFNEMVNMLELNAEIGVASTRRNTMRLMLQDFTEILVKRLDVAFARIWTLNRQENMLELQASAGMYTHIDGDHSRVPVGSFKIGLIAQECKPHMTNDVMNDKRISNPEWAKREGMVAFAGHPLIVEGHVVGVMAMFAHKQLNIVIINLLAMVADKIATAIVRKQAELEIRKSEEKTLLLLNSTGEAIYGLDLEGNCTFCNPSCLSLLGYEDENQLLSRNMHALIHHTRKDGTPYLEDECCIYQAFREGKGTHVDDEVLWRADGTSFPAEYRSFPIFHEGMTVGSVVSFVDITERKKSEIRLGAQHAVTQILAEANTLNEASLKILQIICTALEWDFGEIWAFDRQSCVLKCSEIWHIPSVELPEFEKITRQTTFSPGVGLPGRVISSAQPVWIADVVHDENFPRASVAAKEGLHGAFGFPILSGSKVLGTISFYSREIRKPDKDLLDMMTAIGSQIGLFVRRKQAEETLLQSEKLKAMGMMTSGVAHDFNNILAIISGHTQLLEENYKDDKELTDIIRTIYKAANDGAGIVRRMRQFTKMDRDTSKFVSVNIKKVLEDAISFLKPRWMNIAIAGGKSFDMDMDGIKEIPSILANPSELREVFVNIINNAMDAMSEGGHISFSTWSKEDTVFISISDTGEGMPEDVKKRIFDPFFTTKRAEGSGLGMSEVYGIVTGHGGKIDISSEVGKGATFTLKFPIATETIQEEVLPVPGRKTTTKNLRILVIDDEKDICNVLNMLFSRDGHDVKAVGSGKEAIKLIKSEEFDLVLSDLVMPGLSGHDVIKALDELDKRPKVGLLTGWKEEIEGKDKEKLNVDFIIRKPFDLSELTKQINDLFEI